MNGRFRAVKGPYAGTWVFGTVVNNGAGGITDGGAMLVKYHGAIEVICEGGDALKGMMNICIVEHMNRKCMTANRS